MTGQHLVIIEDERAIADTLIHILEEANFQVNWFATASAGVQHIQTHPVDLVLLDVGLPDANGFDVCKHIRSFSQVPIIFLTARSDEIDRVVGLEIGANDYVIKPFSPREVLARIKLRIQSRTTLNSAQNSDSALHPQQYDFFVANTALNLTAVEYKLLHKLFSHPQQVFSREQLMDAADMAQLSHYARNIDSHIKAIRNKLKAHQLDACIHTKRGFGYFYEQS